MSDTLQRTSIRRNMASEDYLAVRAASKSSLWAIHTRTPLHAVTEVEETSAMAFGTAAHCAVLEPSFFESRYVRGPDDRRGNKWKDALAETPLGMTLLTSGDYDDILRLRDRPLPPLFQELRQGADVELSVFAHDDVPMKCRPDLWSPTAQVMVDLKTTTDAGPHVFRNTCRRYGYHLQDAWYSRVWAAAGGPPVRDFLFLAIESKAPFAAALYRLSPEDRAMGDAIAASALRRYVDCVKSGDWPGYADDVVELALGDGVAYG